MRAFLLIAGLLMMLGGGAAAYGFWTYEAPGPLPAPNVVLVPRGYHTVSAPPGYALYYLNVMAGPVRAWAIANDPDHEWTLDGSRNADTLAR